MPTLHQKLYAYLAGQVDDALTELDGMIASRSYDWAHTDRVYQKLKNALRACEEQYIDAQEEGPVITELPRR